MALPMIHPMHIMMANNEHDRSGNIRTETGHRFQRINLMERTDLTQVENRQGKRACCGTEISGINADKTYAKPQPPWVMQFAIISFVGDLCSPFALLRLRKRLCDSISCSSFFPRIDSDD